MSGSSEMQVINYESFFTFKNVNKIPYYYDKKLYQKINKYNEQKNWEELLPMLTEYVGNFGIQNFYKDTELIWRLAKITELYGNIEVAKKLYKLVLKHHRSDIDLKKLEIYYDSISQNEFSRYVPLDYYYELVDYRREIDTLRPPRGVKRNMGHLINSNASDYGPTLNFDGDVLIFTSKRNRDYNLRGRINEDIFFTRSLYSQWGEAEMLPNINTQYNEGSACLSKDGRTLFFSRCESPDGYGNCDLYRAILNEDSIWDNVVNLGALINSTAWDSHPTLSQTEDTLYFASDRIGGFGLSDIYFTFKDDKGNWVPARNIGPVINSRQNDVSPFYHPKYNILYFSSNGHNLNFGEFDIYKVYADSLGRWGEPKNIGPLVNGAGSEFYFTIDASSLNLFYARSIENDMDNLDLYSFPLPMEAQPLATTVVRGSVLDSLTGNAFDRGIVSIVDLTNGVEVAPQYLSPTGYFEFNLINNNKYLLVVQGDEFFRIEEIFYLEGDMTINTFAESISSRLKFSSIEFDNNSSELKTSMYTDLDKVANFLLDNPNFKLRISGHTDSDGNFDMNMELSRQRAQSIMDYLVYFGGVSKARIDAEGFGNTKPIVEENTDEDKRLNRRVEFELYRPSQEELEKMRVEEERELYGDW